MPSPRITQISLEIESLRAELRALHEAGMKELRAGNLGRAYEIFQSKCTLIQEIMILLGEPHASQR